MKTVPDLHGKRVWTSGLLSYATLRRRLLPPLFVSFVAQTVAAQPFPLPTDLTNCDEAIKIANDADGKMLLEKIVQYDVRAFEICRLQKGADHPDTLGSMYNLANSYSNLGRHSEALKLNEEALGLRRAKLGSDHPDTIASVTNLADSYSDIGRHYDALGLRQETLALRRARLGPSHPDTLASTAHSP